MAKAPRNNIMPSSIQKGVFGLAVPFFWVLFCMEVLAELAQKHVGQGIGVGFLGLGWVRGS